MKVKESALSTEAKDLIEDIISAIQNPYPMKNEWKNAYEALCSYIIKLENKS